MTLLDVLKHHGHNVHPVVDHTGKINYLDDVSTASASSVLKPHTFHGGEADTDAGGAVPWWEIPGAMQKERDAIASAFPGFVDISKAGEPPRWAGAIETGYGSYEIAIVHRRDHGLPFVIPIDSHKRERRAGKRLQRSPHLYDNGFLCVASSSDWNPETDTTATVIGWAAHWHAQFVVWRLGSAGWPSEGYSPNAA